jgi:hypothetical protein
MKIDLQSIDREKFMVHQHEVAGVEVSLVQPCHIGCEWDGKNDIFRSSVWDKDGNPVSLSFKKFFNWDEKPHIYPIPSNLSDAQLMEKLDGSTLIFSRWKKNTIIRTRGTVDARKQDNGSEIDLLTEKYGKFMAWFEAQDNTAHSYVFEWTSPQNKIVIDYGVEPDIVLTAIISHEDYSYATQESLDTFATIHQLRRPKRFSYDSIDEMKASVEAFKGMEGLCVYYNNGQSIRKVKGAQYLFLHRAKTDIASIEKVMDVYFDYSDVLGHNASYQEFFDYITKVYDYEIAVMARGHISNIADGMKEVQEIISGFHVFVSKVKHLSRREAAEKILKAYGQTNRSSMVFKCLDSKPLINDDYKKLLYQILKNK